MAEISKITLPSGSTYDIKDKVARDMISAGVTFIVAWNGTGTPTAGNLPAGVTAGGVTGTLAASAAQAGAFYLVKSSSTPSSQTLDVYDEYVVVKPDSSDSTTWFWEKIGDTQLNLTDVVTGVTLNKSTDTVVGTDSTFTITQPTVALATGATAGTGVISLTTGVSGKGSSGSSVTALTGLGTPSTATVLTGVKVTAQPTVALATGATADDGVISVATNASGTTKYIGGTATGGGAAWNSKDSKTVVTGYASPSTASVSTGVSATSKKLETTSVTGVSGSTTPSVVQGRTSQTTATGSTTASTDNTKILANVSVANEVLTIGAVTLGTQTTYSANAPGTITVPTAASSATTVATGAVADTDTNGATVVTAASSAGSATALTGLGTASTATVVGTSATLTNTQPTITMALADTSATGKVGVVTGVSASTTNIKATASGTAVGANGTASAVTGYPNTTSETIAVSASNTNVKATASGANTAWNNKDSVTVLTSGSSLTVNKGQ